MNPSVDDTPCAAAWVLEWLPHGQRQLSRMKVTQWPLTLGRGYGADVQVDDVHLAAEHLRLQPVAADSSAGGAVPAFDVADLGTVNGWRRLAAIDSRSGPRETGTQRVVAGEWAEAGRTRWRLVRADTPVPAERPLLRQVQAPAALSIAAAAAAVGVVMWQTWMTAFDGFKPLSLLNPALATLGLLLLWSGAWALFSRLMQNPPQFLQHLGWASVASVSALAVMGLADTLAFALDAPLLASWQRPLWIAVIAVALLGHLRMGLGRIGARSAWLVGGLCAGSLALSLADNWQSQRQWLPESFMAVVRPSGWMWSEPKSLDSLIERAAADKPQLDALRAHESDVEDDGF